MLEELFVRDMGVIGELSVEFGRGMTVVTGETGAGKTLIIEALSLLCGSRADPGSVRTGCDSSRIEARFTYGGSEFILARQVNVRESSRAYVNGSLSRLSDLSECTAGLFHIYGQHDSQYLLSTTAQSITLDNFCNIDHSELRELRNRLKFSEDSLASLGGDERSRQRELAICAMELEQLEAADLNDPAEEDKLREELELLSSAEFYRGILEKAGSELFGGTEQESVMDLLGSVRNSLVRASRYEDLATRTREIISLVDELARDLRIETEKFDTDPRRLDEIHQRLQSISKLKNRFGDTLSEIIRYRERLRKRIDELGSFEQSAAKLEKDIAGYRSQVRESEGEVRQRRMEGAAEFARSVERRLGDLAMPNSRFEVVFGETPVGDPVTFHFSPNPGEQLRPISKAASGGELSRIMLAIRLLASADVETMIFDEVDAGIGGRTAISIGKALAELALEKQVIVVTHLAQVAAFADGHIAIHKSDESGRSITHGKVVEGEERVSELARMLSGHHDSRAAKEHARELLEGARSS